MVKGPVLPLPSTPGRVIVRCEIRNAIMQGPVHLARADARPHLLGPPAGLSRSMFCKKWT